MKPLFSLIITVSLGLSLLSCGGKEGNGHADESEDSWEETELTEETEGEQGEDSLLLYDDLPVPKSADMLFDDFFYNFSTDASFQRQRVVFPLPVKEGAGTIQMGWKDWKTVDKFGDLSLITVIYDRERDMGMEKDTSLNEVKVEWIDLTEKTVEEYYFQRKQEEWKLQRMECGTPMSQVPNADFLEFYAAFSSDTAFQRKSLGDPLTLMVYPEDGEEEVSEVSLTADDWFLFCETAPLPTRVLTNFNYGQSALSENRKILLVESGGLYIKYKFDHLDGKWRLIEISNE